MLLGWLVKEEEGVKHVTSVEDKKNSYSASVKKPGDGRPIVRPKHRWEGNIKIGLKVGIIGLEVVDWYLAEDTGRWRALVNMVMNLQVPVNGEIS